MHKSRIAAILLVFVLAALVGVAAMSAQENTTMPQEQSAVFEISVYRVLDGSNFAARSTDLSIALNALEGVTASQSYNTFFAIPSIPEGETYAVRITEWASAETYTALTDLTDNETVSAYLATVETVQSVVVQPFVLGEELSVDGLATSGQVLELAIRDISTYEDPVDFLRTIRGFTHQLTMLDGVVREYEWLSVDGQYFVGMTQYESLDAFMAASQNEALMTSAVTAAVFSQYPPMLAQMALPAGE